MGDVDPTGDRTWRGDNQPKVYFADLRREVELAARRHAELSEHADEIVAERDRLRAVVDAVRAYVHSGERRYSSIPWQRMVAALDRLDVSPEATDG
jgi:hypothetical protein